MTAIDSTRPLPPRIPDELEHEHCAFLAWLVSSPRPTPLEAGVVELAARNCWVQRAIAWEWQQRLQLGTRSPPEILRDLVEDQILAARIAAAKILDSEAGSKNLTPEGAATIDRMAKLAELAKSLPARTDANAQIDWGKFTPEERERVLEAQRILELKGTK